MRKPLTVASYNVPLTTWANITVTVETDETDPEKIAELAMGQAGVSLCHQCGGSRNDGLEVGDDWDVSRMTPDSPPEVYRLDD